MKLIRIVEDKLVAPGVYVVGGVRVVDAYSDEDLGRELRTIEIRVHGDQEAHKVREIIEESDHLAETK